MVNEKPFTPLPDPWVDGPGSEVLMFPVYWNNTRVNLGTMMGRESGVLSFGPATLEEIGARDRLKIQAPGAATPVFLNERQVEQLIAYLQEGLWRSR